MQQDSLRLRTYRALNGTGRLGRTVTSVIVFLILANVLTVIIESHTSPGDSVTLPLAIFEACSVIIFSIEYVFRVWSCVEDPRFANRFGRIRFCLTFASLVDIAAILPFYVSVGVIADARVLRSLRLLRFFRVFKLGRYARSLRMLGEVFSDRFPDLVSSILVICVLLIFSSSMMYFAEHEVQPDRFPNITESMWWGIATLSTVGYGDVTPITGAGKFVAGLVSLLGIGVFALPAGILASGYAEALERVRKPLSNDTETPCPHCGRP